VPQAAPSPRPGEQGAIDVAAVERKLQELSGRKLPLPSPSPTAATDAVRTAAVRPVAPVPQPVEALGFAPDDADESPAVKAMHKQAPVKDGWQIQIGATPSRASALGLLKKARTKAPDLLASVSDYTETVEKGNDTLYRARFAGFASKSDAWSACGALKRKKFACLALAN
jgi:cell division septation protein DedD